MKEVKILNGIRNIVDVNEVNANTHIGCICDADGSKGYLRQMQHSGQWKVYYVSKLNKCEYPSFIHKRDTQRELAKYIIENGWKVFLFENQKEFFTWMAED